MGDERIMNTRGGNVPCGGNVPRRPRTGVIGGFQQLVAALQHAFSEQSRTYVEIARSHGVTDLNIVGACEEAEDWLENVEDVFEVINCPDEERAETAGYFLRGGAKTWWMSTKRSRPSNPPMTWRTFRRLFSDYFLGRQYKASKRQEFYDLRQGNMSVTELDCKFRRLARYVPSVYEHPQEMMNQLDIALSDEIRPYMQYDSDESMIQAVLRVERSFLTSSNQNQPRNQSTRGRGFRSRSTRERSSSSNIGPRHSLSFKRRGQGSGSSSEGSGTEAARQSFSHFTLAVPMCMRCGRRHRGNCAGRTDSCFRCGGIGHYACDCPTGRPIESIAFGSGYGGGNSSGTQNQSQGQHQSSGVASGSCTQSNYAGRGNRGVCNRGGRGRSS